MTEDTNQGISLKDGLMELGSVLSLQQIMCTIERTARWVSPETFHYLPVWYPEHARGAEFYKANWSEKQMNTSRLLGHSIHKREANRYAQIALTMALGLRTRDRPNWSCCHIWGVDDDKFQKSNSVVKDRRFYSCVANMVLLPTPLKAFTDAMPEVKAMLRICARQLYGWTCDHIDLSNAVRKLDQHDSWDDYPESWPRPGRPSHPLGVMPFTQRIRNDADKRLKVIHNDLTTAGPEYPFSQVSDALTYWQNWLPGRPLLPS